LNNCVPLQNTAGTCVHQTAPQTKRGREEDSDTGVYIPSLCVCTFSSFGTLGFDPLGFCIMREQTSIANQSPNYYYSPARFAVAMEAQEMCD